MSISDTLHYFERAMRFALIFGLAFLGLRILTQTVFKRQIRRGRECLLFVFAVYLAALLHITVWREGPDLDVVFSGGGHDPAQLTLFNTTISHWAAGWRRFFYHTGGNAGWFFPLGVLLPMVTRRWRFPEVLLSGMALSISIEILQWLLRTGITDIDDVLFNTLGTGIGYILAACARKVLIRLRNP